MKIWLIALLAFMPSAFAMGPNPYYDQLYSDGRLDISIFLSFEQLKPTFDPDPGETPVIKQIIQATTAVVREVGEISPIRDSANTMADVNAVEQGILGCSGCGFQKISEDAGLRVYATQTTYKNKPIDVTVKFYYADAAVPVSRTKRCFENALGNDDVIVYLGHSRIGHGFPDFAAPSTDAGMVFVNDPVRGWTGFEKGYFARNKYQILFLNACYTQAYYQNALRAKAWEKDPSKLALILSSDKTWFDDYPATTQVFLEGLLGLYDRDEMLAALYDAAQYYQDKHRDDEKKMNVFVGDGLFDETYDRKPRPKKRFSAEPWHPIPF